jgi:hypothetical protein
MDNDRILAVLTEIRNWTRAASYGSVKKLLEEALPDEKSRVAYQMMGDATPSMEEVRIACKIGSSTLFELANRWTAMGLMEVKGDKRRARLFDLNDFGLLDTESQSKSPAKR